MPPKKASAKRVIGKPVPSKKYTTKRRRSEVNVLDSSSDSDNGSYFSSDYSEYESSSDSPDSSESSESD